MIIQNVPLKRSDIYIANVTLTRLNRKVQTASEAAISHTCPEGGAVAQGRWIYPGIFLFIDI